SCVTQYDKSDLVVVAGALNAVTATSDQQWTIATMFPRADFVCPMPVDLDNTNDIGMIVLNGSVSALSVIPTYTFDPSVIDLPEGTPLAIQGYGRTSATDPTFGQLNAGQVPYQQQASPQKGQTEFVAGTADPPHVCYGDSGSPIYVSIGGTTYVVGITSRGAGSPDARCDEEAGIYTILSAYDDWL